MVTRVSEPDGLAFFQKLLYVLGYSRGRGDTPDISDI